MKFCTKCKKEKDISLFGKDSYAKDGLKHNCKECVNFYSKNKVKKKDIFTCISCNETKEVDYYSNKKRKTNYCLKCLSKNTQT